MYGAPLLLAISSVTHNHPSRTLQWLDAVQVLLAAYLAYTVIFSVSPFNQRSIAPIPASLLVLTYNVENLVLACCASLRLLAHRRDGGQGRFYLLLTVFLWCYAGCAATYNYLTLHGVTQAWSEVLPSLPFLTLVLLATHVQAAQSGEENTQAQQAPQKLTLLIDNFSPIFFTAALLGLGFAVMRAHFYLAAASLFVALLVHALRSATLQSRYMQSELALRAAHDKLEKLSLTDGLTGIANRRCFDQTLQLEWQRAARSHQGLALLSSISISSKASTIPSATRMATPAWCGSRPPCTRRCRAPATWRPASAARSLPPSCPPPMATARWPWRTRCRKRSPLPPSSTRRRAAAW